MRIISVRPVPIGQIFALTYAVFGLAAFIQFAASKIQAINLPVGILIGIFHLNLNFHVNRSADLLANAFLCVGAVFSYGLSGWITGIAVALCFNFVAQKTGGIDAKFVVTEDSSTSSAGVSVG